MLGCNSAYRTDVLREDGYPDHTLGEDVLLSHRLRQTGVDLVYDPGVEVTHLNREGMKEFFRYNKKMGTASAAYTLALRRPRSQLFLSWPILAFLTLIMVLPLIFVRLLHSSRSRRYLTTYLMLLPLCLAGNLAWAAAFRQRVLSSRSQRLPG